MVLLVPFRLAAAQVTPGVSLLREARTPVLATLLMAPVVWWLRDAIHPLAAIAAGAVVYPLALWSLGGIDAQQRRPVCSSSGPEATLFPDGDPHASTHAAGRCGLHS